MIKTKNKIQSRAVITNSIKTSEKTEWRQMDCSALNREQKIIKCGEVLMVTNEWNFKFMCSFCEKEFSKIEYLIMHTLERHTTVTEKQISLLLDNMERITEENLKSEDNSEESHHQEDSDNYEISSESSKESRKEVSITDGERLLQKDTTIVVTEDGEEMELTILSCSDNGEISEGVEYEIVEKPNKKNEIEILDNILIKNATSFPLNATESELDSIKCPVKNKIKPKKKTENPLTCEYCGISISHKKYLKNHIYRHFGVKHFKCLECDRSFVVKMDLKRHMSLHTGEKRYMCGECGKKYTSSGSLARHRRIHTNERRFVCNICGKAFYTGTTLRSHTISHTEERAFSCSQCGTTYRRKNALTLHIQTQHELLKPYPCVLCTMTFTEEDKLNRHLQTHFKRKDH